MAQNGNHRMDVIFIGAAGQSYSINSGHRFADEVELILSDRAWRALIGYKTVRV